MYPTREELNAVDFKVAHWSYFENWDPYRHYLFARDTYNIKAYEKRNSGTYTNFGQVDTPLCILNLDLVDVYRMHV